MCGGARRLGARCEVVHPLQQTTRNGGRTPLWPILCASSRPQVRFFDKAKGKWRVHRLDDRIPYDPIDSSAPLCCHVMPNHATKIDGQGWLPLLEKNLAILMDGFHNLSGGYPHCALEASPGAAPGAHRCH